MCEICGSMEATKHYVPEYEVYHVVCYDCGAEWVE